MTQWLRLACLSPEQAQRDARSPGNWLVLAFACFSVIIPPGGPAESVNACHLLRAPTSTGSVFPMP